MASVSGSQLAFFAPGSPGSQVNVVTFDGTNLSGPTVAGKFNIEVFTTAAAAAGPLGAGFQASAFIQGAVTVAGTNNEVRAATLGSTEQLLTGNYLVVDRTGSESIQMAGAGIQAVVGSSGDTISGSTVSGSSQLWDLTGANAIVKAGAMTAIGGAGSAVVWAGNGDSIAGGTGSMLVAGNDANSVTVTGGAGDLAVFNLGKGNSVTGSTSGFTFVGDGYGGSNNTIGGSTSTVASGTIFGITFPASTVIIGGNQDVINGAAGTMLVNSLSTSGDTITGGAGAATVWGGTATTVKGGSGALQFNLGTGSSVTAGAGKLNAFALGTGNTIGGGSSGGDFIDDSYPGPGKNMLIGGTAATRIIGGSGDTIVAGTGALQAEIKTGFGTETVNLSASAGADGVRDVASVAGGTAATVTGFGANDVIESATNVTAGGLFTGSSSSGPTGTNLTFSDGNTMFIAGVVSVGAIKFTQ